MMYQRIAQEERDAIDKALDYLKTITPGPFNNEREREIAAEVLAQTLYNCRGQRFMVDGRLSENADDSYAADGQFGPFYVFDQVLQENESGPYETREEAQRRVDDLKQRYS